MHLDGPVLSRLYLQYPMLRSMSQRPFGVEIECCGLDYWIIPPDNGVVKLFNIKSRARDGRSFDELLADIPIDIGGDRDHWHFEEDSSIVSASGVELISPILQGPGGLYEVICALHFLTTIERITINGSCGFHVHHGVDRSRFRCPQLQHLVRIVAHVENKIFQRLPERRRHCASCRPLELDLKRFLEPCGGDCERDGCHLKKAWYSPGNRYDGGGSERYDHTRDHGLNLHSYWYRSTIEFRYHAAVLEDFREACEWILFSQILVDMAQDQPPPIHYFAGCNPWLRILYETYLDFGLEDRIRTGFP